MKMKRFIIFSILILLLPGLNGCKDFLNVDPLTNMSGNNFWQTQDDVEQFTRGLYNRLRQKVTVNSYYIVIGDLRCSPWIQTSGNNAQRDYIDHLARNDIRTVVSTDAESWDYYFDFSGISKWGEFYKVIQGANILYDKVDEVPDPSFSDAKRKKYKAEAVFIRNLTYFFMVRMYGDVPYYTDAFHKGTLERMPMVEVLKKCIKDMGAVTEDLPWTYNDPAKRGVRAMRGSALVLMMHMNMWLAGFDDDNKTAYWRATDSLGEHLLDDNRGAYELLPFKDYKQIFDGRSKEGLFEIPQNLNYGESFIYSTFSDMVLHYPHKQPAINDKSYMYPNSKFLDKMFPEGESDQRKDAWLLSYDPNEMTSTTGGFEYLKYVNIFAQEGEDVNPDDNLIIFRLPDAILLRAEALNDLGKDEGAREMLNLVRNRAEAEPAKSTVSGKDLGDMIYWERCRELLGEGYYYYTLVRTKKVVDKDYCWHPIPVSAFKQGAWTWPIDKSALKDNPKMQLNTYWTN